MKIFIMLIVTVIIFFTPVFLETISLTMNPSPKMNDLNEEEIIFSDSYKTRSLYDVMKK